MNVQQDGDRMVDAYLSYLTKAAEPLPAERRTELVADVRAHIAEARAAGANSESEVQQVLRDLGDPDDIVAAATDGLVLVEQPPRLRLRDFAALALLLFGPVLLVVGWLVGVWLLWTSDRWNRGEKLLGTLAWPATWAAAFVAEIVFQPQIWMDVVGAELIAVAVTVVLAMNARPGRSA
jgi:hypothetical protein